MMGTVNERGSTATKASARELLPADLYYALQKLFTPAAWNTSLMS